MKQMGKILVEFYDAECIENIMTLLYGNAYARVVYVYFAEANLPTAEDRAALKRYVKTNFGITPEFLEVRENTMECALARLRSLAGDSGHCDIDITGGSSVFIAAAGALAAEDRKGRIALHEYDPRTGRLVFCFPERELSGQGGLRSALTADHVFDLRGIRVLYPERQVRYRLDRDDLRGEIARLWEIVRWELKAWNTFTVLPTRMEWQGDHFAAEKKMTAKQRQICDDLLDKLQERGVISDLRQWESGNGVAVSYCLHVPKSAVFLYDKGGNILEMMTYMSAMDCGCFRDACTGISLDWDDAGRRMKADPYNEIDAVLMRDHIPCFVSCKTAEVENEYLYEIMIMARHYGGRYAVPALVTATACNIHLHARAKEMGIVLIDRAGELNTRQFAQKIKDALGAK